MQVTLSVSSCSNLLWHDGSCLCKTFRLVVYFAVAISARSVPALMILLCSKAEVCDSFVWHE